MEKSVQTLRFLGLDMINKANSGHPGIVLGAANTVYELFTKHLNANPEQPKWFNRDRFFLAAGHGSALLYSLLHLSGYNISIEDLKNFRQLNSITPGHPEYGHTPGVDSTTGPLGQGVAMAIGNAIAEAYLAGRFNKNEFKVVDHYTYALCGDGDLQEGVTLESLSLAGRLELNKLIVLFDSNDIQLDGPTKNAVNENLKMKMESMHWNYILVKTPNDTKGLAKALKEAKNSNKPTFIEVKSIIGFGSALAGTSKTHGAPIGVEETNRMRERFGYNYKEFEVDPKVYDDFQDTFVKRGKEKYQDWLELLEAYSNLYPDDFYDLMNIINNVIDVNFEEIIPQVDIGTKEATRATMGKLLETLSEQIPAMMGGSADLSSSTKVKGINGDFESTNPIGRNINFGVREHAMAAIINGMTLHNLKAFSGGFLIFSDYMKPAMRLSALMGIPSIFIFTHDSVAVGEDGPTHEPVEQLSMFRATPNLVTIRPANANETRHAIRYALTSENKPTVIALTRQNLTTLNKVAYEDFSQGAYVVSDEKDFEGIIIATGSELELALKVQEALKKNHKKSVRVVSMPSMELFSQQPRDIKEKILPESCQKRLAIEMAATLPWYKYARNVYGIDSFGKSGKGEDVIESFGFTVENIVNIYLNI